MQARATRPLKWDGGKGLIAPWLASLCPAVGSYDHYVEPYAGGLALLFELTDAHEGVSEVVNDLSGDVTNFWRVLQSPRVFAQFERLCQATPHSEVEWRRACELSLRCEAPMWRAWAMLVKYRQSRAARGVSFCPITRYRRRRGMQAEAAAWLGVVEGLREAHDRMRRVCVLDARDAVSVIDDENTTKTFFYLDPPYLAETLRTGQPHYAEGEAHGEEHHERLLDRLSRLAGKFLLSGYRSDLYDSWANRCNWTREDRGTHHEGSDRVECTWRNYG